MDMQKTIFWQGEAQLLGWSETNTRGRTITLQLGEDEETHPFKHTVTKHGKTSGKRFAVVFVEIGDDEQVVEKTPSQLCYLVCKDPIFWSWAGDRSFDAIDNEAAARYYVLTTCAIKSRSELDSNINARITWETMIYEPFNRARQQMFAV